MSAAPNHAVALSTAIDIESEGFSRIHEENVLAPGFYWRAKEDITQKDKNWDRVVTIIEKDEVVLLLDVHEFEGVAHSVQLLEPPSSGGHQTYSLLVEDFFAKMEPCHDAQAVRDREQAEIMERVRDIQDEMAQAEVNPLALPGIQESVEKAVAQFEKEEERSVSQREQSASEREKDLRRIHRRAARRSDAAGNPLVVQNVVISNQLSDMIDGGVTSEGLKELTLESRRRTAVATATARWLTERAEKIGRTMQQLTPYYAERAKVALARSKKAIKYAEEISKGLKSLELYTGDGVDVVEVRRGQSASTAEPLTLVQGKRFMAEEVAIFADVDDSFDFASTAIFFDLLAKNDALRNVVFPTERCVVSMAVNRHRVNYGEKVSAFEAAMRDAQNRLVFLLVRDGDNIHVVYSSEPSHEAAHRLFPSDEDIAKPFKGIDGTKINLKDVAFIEASRRFEDQALHYKRFLILLCGLDHRLHLMGEFYPPECCGLQFMSQEFQAKYFHFLEDEGRDRFLELPMEPVEDWMERCNNSLRSGSRVMLSAGASENSPALTHLRYYGLAKSELKRLHVVSREGKHHYVSVLATPSYRSDGEDKTVKVWLDGPDAKSRKSFLCLDLVRAPTIYRYIHSRIHRSHSIGWIRIFKRIHAHLSAELVRQAELRSHLRANALAHGGLAEDQVDEAIEMGIMTWRAGHRGADAPDVTDTKEVNAILTLMYPSEKIATAIDNLLGKLIAEESLTPLKLVRTGKTRLALYVEANSDDKAPYAPGCKWGWVKRLVLEPRKTKLSVASTSLVWLEKEKVDPTEEEMRTWPELGEWLNAKAEPTSLRRLEKFTQSMQVAIELFSEPLRANRFSRGNKPLDDALFLVIQERYAAHYRAATTYSNDAQLSIPVGMYQSESDGLARFLYMVCRAIDFVHFYGDDVQTKTLAGISARYGFPRRCETMKEPLCQWRLATTKEPLTQWVTEGVFSAPNFLLERIQVNQKRSTYKKTKGDGKPQLSDTDVTLSFNRAFDALMQKAPHLKRNFYVNLRKEIAREMRFSDFDGGRSKKVKQLGAKKYEPSNSAKYLSPLVWSASAGRSFACRLFGAAKKQGNHL
jgi:hypothetical protein